MTGPGNRSRSNPPPPGGVQRHPPTAPVFPVETPRSPPPGSLPAGIRLADCGTLGYSTNALSVLAAPVPLPSLRHHAAHRFVRHPRPPPAAHPPRCRRPRARAGGNGDRCGAIRSRRRAALHRRLAGVHRAAPARRPAGVGRPVRRGEDHPRRPDLLAARRRLPAGDPDPRRCRPGGTVAPGNDRRPLAVHAGPGGRSPRPRRRLRRAEPARGAPRPPRRHVSRRRRCRRCGARRRRRCEPCRRRRRPPRPRRVTATTTLLRRAGTSR